MEIEGKFINYQKVFQTIEGLKDTDKDKAIKQGLRDAMNVFIRAGRQNLLDRLKGNDTTGNLKSSFKNKLKRNSLGAVAGFSQLGAHSHLIDRGTTERFTKDGKSRGKVEGNHFWDDAIEQNQGEAIDKVYIGIEKAVTRLMNRN